METKYIPSSVSHHQGLNAAERFESYRVAASPLCSVEPVGKKNDAYCSGWMVDDLLFCQTRFTRSVFRRDPKRARGGCGFLMQYYGGGEQRGEVDGDPFYCGEDRIVIQDISRPYSAVGQVKEIFSVFIPRHRFTNPERLFGRRPALSWPVTSPRGRILLQTLRSTVESLPELRQSNAAIVATGFLGLVNGLAATEDGLGEDEHVNEACLETMKAYVVQNLQDPGLSPDSLGKTFACSRAKVYRLFAEAGGVAAFIRQQRLTRCFRELNRAQRGQTTVHQVAERWGFLDPYHFSKLFKRTFNATPSDVLMGQGDDTSNGVQKTSRFAGGTALSEWVRTF